MTSLAGRTLIDTYRDLLQISNGNAGVDDTARYIEDGEGTPSILSLSTTRVGVGTDTPQYTLDVAGDINMTGTFKVNGQDAVFSNWTVETDNSLSRSTNVSIVGDLDVSGSMSVANVLQVASNGAVGGVTPTVVGQIIAWDGAKWVVANNAGASSSGSSSEVPAAFSAALTSGQSVHTINFQQTYDSIPSVVTDLQITGDGDVIPYVITDVTTSSLTVTFTDNIPNNNYKLNISFGGRDVYWSQDVLDRISYTAGNVGIGTTIPVADLEVAGVIRSSSPLFPNRRADFFVSNNADGNLNINCYDDTLSTYQPIFIDASELYLNSKTNGNVGIGTSNPGAKLEVLQDLDTSSGASILKVTNTRLNTGTSSSVISLITDEVDGNTADERVQLAGSYDGTNGGKLDILTNNGLSLSPVVTIKHNGNVGIGTTSPNHVLHVQGPNDTTFVNGRSTMNLTGTDAYDQDAGSGINFCGRYRSNGEITTFATIHAEQENADGSSFDGSLVFGTRRTGTGSESDLERMRITSLGELALNTTSPWYVYNQSSGEGAMSYLPPVYGARAPWGATSTSGGSLMISNHAAHSWANVYINRFGYSSGLDGRFIDFIINGTGVGASISINNTGDGVNYNTGSDRRLKGNIVDMTDGKDVVMQLKPRRFIWKSTHAEGDGFIADELSQVIPHAVTGEPDATNDDGSPKYQGVDYSKVVPVLTGALQQALQEIEQLKTRIENLENK
jgi:hypothetical protein